jgi:ferredoxin
MGLDDLIDAAQTVWRVPDVNGSRCVHSQLETAHCRRCVDACPRGAWVIDDEMLGINTEACDGCGLCVPACPEEAILCDYFPDVRMRRDAGEFGFACCEYAITDSMPGRTPCVHSIGLPSLLRLYKRGVRRLFVSCGDCRACPRAADGFLDHLVERLNSLLVARSLAPLMMVTLAARAWQELRETTEDASLAAVSRRGFLRGATARAVDRTTSRLPDLGSSVDGDGAIPPGHILPRTDARQPAFSFPVMHPMRCNGCDACIRVCPHGVIAIVQDGDAYGIDADACSGCGLCVDVCDCDAVSIGSWTMPAESIVPLDKGRCVGCGADFHRPAVQERPGQYCRICEGTGHYKSLFQVME